jgi:hypothetical protein
MTFMRSARRIVAGGLCGVTAAVIWAESLAVYQQLMEPTGFFSDETGRVYPNLASNNTYWPRETRHMAILLAFAGVAVICRAAFRGLAAGAVGSAVWLCADLWLDRVDIDGRTAAWWLGVAGIVGFAATAGVAARLARGRPGTSRSRYFAAATLPLLAALTTSIMTPWDEPVIDLDHVTIENALTLFKVGLVAMFLVAMVALLVDDLNRAHAWWAAAFLTVAAVAAGLAIDAQGYGIAPMALFLAGLLAVAAAHDVPRTRLIVVAVTGALMLPVVIIVLFIGGRVTGQFLTSIAGNPAVNAADTDLTDGLPGLLCGVLVATVTQAVTAAAGAASGERRPVPAVAEP